jgi:hypothetical protein
LVSNSILSCVRFRLLQVVVVLAMWCASLPYLMDGDHRFAVLEGDFAGISNGNIFFSSWGALIFSLLLATSHFEIYYDRADEDKHLYHWVGFTTASLVVMCSTARYFNRVCSDVELEDEPTCSRAAFGLVLGAISTVVGISITWVDITLVYTQMTSVIFLVAWCFAAAYLTFDEGPGVAIGTLYFATWFGLLFILFIAASAILEMFHKILDSAPAEETPPVEGDAAVSKDNEVVDTKMGDEEVEEEEVAETA